MDSLLAPGVDLNRELLKSQNRDKWNKDVWYIEKRDKEKMVLKERTNKREKE